MKERVVVVIGGSSGIGRATALVCAARGDRVVLASRGKTALAAAVEECAAVGGGQATATPVDVRDSDAVTRLIAETVEAYGRIDAVVHAAGVVAYGSFVDVPPAVFNAVLETNVLGAANVSRAVLPVFRDQGHGSLILVGSVLGEIAIPGMSAYVVSKHALKSLGRHLALEHHDLPDVHVSVVSPGAVDTPIYRQAANYLGHPGRPPAPVIGPASVARSIVRALDRPRDRISVGPANSLMRVGFTLLPRVFDAIVGPIFRVAGTTPEAQAPTTGNVLEPHDELEATRGGRGQGIRDLFARVLPIGPTSVGDNRG